MSLIKGFTLLSLIFILFIQGNLNTYTITFIIFFIPFLVLLNKYNCLKKEFKNEREHFIKTLSHDLRVATLAQIRALDILQKNSTSEQKDFVKEINDSCKFSLDMITTLLNSYKFKNGECVLEYENFDFSQLINQVFIKNKQLLEEKNILLNLKQNNNIYIDADKAMLSKAVTILLETAITNSAYTQEININTKQEDNSITFSVFYKGLPLTEEEYNRIFSEKHVYTTVGHGIKMQLCKKIIDFHSGKIKVSNFENNNNLLTFTIPKSKKQNILKRPSYLSLRELCQEK